MCNHFVNSSIINTTEHACMCSRSNITQQPPSAEVTMVKGDVLTCKITLVDIIAGGEAARAGQTCRTTRNMHQTFILIKQREM